MKKCEARRMLIGLGNCKVLGARTEGGKERGRRKTRRQEGGEVGSGHTWPKNLGSGCRFLL